VIIEHPFVNQIVGTAAGFRDTSLNSVWDSASLEIPERDPSEFPVATAPTGTPGEFRGSLNVTRWHDGSHWTVLHHGHDRFAADTLRTDVVARSNRLLAAEPFAAGTPFREIVHDMRDEIVAAMQHHLDSNVALIGGELWRRCEEPSYALFPSCTDGRVVITQVTPRQHWDVPLGYKGQLFRIDDRDGLRDELSRMLAMGWRLKNTDGILWSLPDIEVLIPESVGLDPEGQTAVNLARSAAGVVPRTRIPEMTYAEIEALCFLEQSMAGHRYLPEVHDDLVPGALEAARTLRRFFPDPAGVEAAIHLAAERWDNRPIDAPGVAFGGYAP